MATARQLNIDHRDTDAVRLLVDVQQAARMLGCGRSFLYTLIQSGTLPVVKLGRLTRIRVEDLDDLINVSRTRW